MDDSCQFITVEAESNPWSLWKWLSIIEEGKTKTKGTHHFSLKAKKHLSALGWRFAHVPKGTSREMRYKSPEGKWFNSLVTACEWLDPRSQQKENQEPACCWLVSNAVEDATKNVFYHPSFFLICVDHGSVVNNAAESFQRFRNSKELRLHK